MFLLCLFIGGFVGIGGSALWAVSFSVTIVLNGLGSDWARFRWL